MIFLVDGSNAVRGKNYDPRFPEMEQARTEAWLLKLDSLASGRRGAEVEVFFDGPRRGVGVAASALSVRFPVDGDADEAILGSARHVLAMGKGVTVVTGDGELAEQARSEGARVIGFAELENRLRRSRG
ncbi:MAG: NYN domain-containing protein [Elusimicrobiota bacterium]